MKPILLIDRCLNKIKRVYRESVFRGKTGCNRKSFGEGNRSSAGNRGGNSRESNQISIVGKGDKNGAV